MTEANERVLEQLRRARDAGDNLEAALRARIAAEQDPDSRARLSDRLREVQAHSGAIEGRLGVLTPSPSPIDLGVTVATLPLRVGVNAAKAVVGEALSLALGVMGLSGDRGREGDPVRHQAAENRALAIYAALSRVARLDGDERTAGIANEARDATQRLISELDDEGRPVPRPARREAPRRRMRANGSAPAATPIQAAPEPEPTPSAPPIPDEQQHVSEEPTLVAEFAEQGAEDGAGPEISVQEPWEGYRRMKVQEIVQRLASESDEVVAVVELYEAANRRRQTVLRAAERRLRTGSG